MPYAQPILIGTFKAQVAMATKYIAVKLGTSADEVDISGDGETAIGILMDTAAAVGDSVRVCLLGICPVKANAAFSKGDQLQSAASTGKVDTADAVKCCIGWALEAATAQDDEVSCLVVPSLYAAS